MISKLKVSKAVRKCDSGWNGPGSSPGQGHCVVYLCQTQCLSPPRCMGTSELTCNAGAWGVTLPLTLCGFESRSEPEFFSGLCCVAAALALMTVVTQLLPWTKLISLFTILGPTVTSTCKGLTRIQPLSCGFDSLVGRALHRHRKVVGSRGFESHSEPEFFSGLCSSSWRRGGLMVSALDSRASGPAS